MTGTAICFDLDGTLVRLTEPYPDLLAATFESHLGESDPGLVETYDEAFYEAFEALDPAPAEQGMAAVLDAAGADGDPAAMAETLRDREYAACEVSNAARSTLETLADGGTLGVVTNGLRDWQVGKLEHVGIDHLFDAVVTSYEAGAHKPDAAPFDLARERLDAEEYAMVGDDYEADVEGARAAGFVPIHFEDGDGPNFWTTVEAML